MTGERPTADRGRLVRRAPGYAGLVGAVLFLCASLTPSLLPRGWLLQGAVSGVTAAFGYGIGAAVGAVLRRRGWVPSSPVASRAGWWLLAVGGPALVAFYLWQSLGWQDDARRLVGMEPLGVDRLGLELLAAVAVAAVLVLLARSVRLLARTLGRPLARVLPRRVAVVGGAVAAAALVVGFVQGVLLDGLLAAANQSFSLADEGTSEGIEQPTSPTRSGSPESLVAWDDLGLKGRDFTGGGPTAEQLGAVRAGSAEPVRVYVGLEAADGPEEAAALAVRELERAGGFDRAVLAVVTTTGTGWVDEQMAASLEYMHGGDTAMVATQYSYLPSWLSFLVDRSKAAAASEALSEAVVAAVAERPEGQRPMAVVAGESLGSYGTEVAFGELETLRGQTDGALLIGPPNVNPIWDGLTTGRDPASPVWRPVVDGGREVRFAQAPEDLDDPAGPWAAPRVVYLQNASDPIVWWAPDLLWQRPEWLDEPRGPDVSPRMRWYPVVTFWQVVVDLAFSTGVPEGHGHRYGSGSADGWAAVVPPPGWTDADTLAVKTAVGQD